MVKVYYKVRRGTPKRKGRLGVAMAFTTKKSATCALKWAKSQDKKRKIKGTIYHIEKTSRKGNLKYTNVCITNKNTKS